MTRPALQLRGNEQGSVSVRASDGGHVLLKVSKQTQNGDIEAEYEIGLEPNSLMHVESIERPEPESADD